MLYAYIYMYIYIVLHPPRQVEQLHLFTQFSTHYNYNVLGLKSMCFSGCLDPSGFGNGISCWVYLEVREAHE